MHPRHRRGYVLLMTLVLIVLAGFLLTSVARHSLRAALDALELQQEMQRRWAAYSCRQALLPRFEQILTSQRKTRDERKAGADDSTPDDGHAADPAYAPLVARFVLADMQVTLLLADENAKINLNTACRVHGRGEVNRLVRALASDRHLPPIRTRPELDKDGRPSFQSWGQIFAFDQARRDVNVPLALLRATTSLTCWGSGKLHPHRASDLALEQLCRHVLAPRDVERLLELRRKHPKHTGEQLTQGLALRQSEADRLSELFGEGPSCRSLWLVTTTPRRSYYELDVIESRVFEPADEGRAGNFASTADQEREKTQTVTYHFAW